MSSEFFAEKVKQSPSRKMPLLPRIGIVVDFGKRRFTFRHVPLLETLAILVERGPSVLNFRRIIKEQLSEVALPEKSKKRTVDVEARTISSRRK